MSGKPSTPLAMGRSPRARWARGVGMSCFGYKGGIGTASRHVQQAGAAYVLGALVLANFGRPEELTIDGEHQVLGNLPVGLGNLPVGGTRATWSRLYWDVGFSGWVVGVAA